MARKLTNEEIKSHELEMLRELDSVAKENGLNLYLCGGTLLGAIRHKGFIPWDDDVDVCLPRPDYNRLVRLNREKKLFSDHLKLVCPEDGTFMFPFMKLVDIRTTTKKMYGNDIPHLWVDIFPVDGLPDDRKKANKVLKKVSFLRRLLYIRNAEWGEGRTLFHKLSKLVLIPLSRIITQKKYVSAITGTAKQCPYGSTKHCGIVTMGLYGPGERISYEGFRKPTEVSFEGETYRTYSNWDEYLSGIYGDYMQLPPEEKRKTHDMEVTIKE